MREPAATQRNTTTVSDLVAPEQNEKNGVMGTIATPHHKRQSGPGSITEQFKNYGMEPMATQHNATTKKAQHFGPLVERSPGWSVKEARASP